ncbi:MAG: aldehyde dehydrogenase family protein [Pseudomonadota bacterium]
MSGDQGAALEAASVQSIFGGPTPAEQAANKAAQAYWSWTTTPPEERTKVLNRAADEMIGATERLADIAAREIGAAPAWIDFNIDVAAQVLRRAGELTALMTDEVIVNAERRTRSVLRRQSVGVVLGFAPWNAPIALAVRAVAAPLACGNTVVLKASEHCPETHQATIDVLRAAGLPEGVATSVSNTPETSAEVMEALIRHPAVRRINFTGSTRVGRLVAASAARELKRCLLELSGKAPLIVLEDADLDAAAEAAALGAFFNQGQICMSTERIIVLQAVADAFVEKLLACTARLVAADPAESDAPLGRLINHAAADRVRGMIDDAVSKGARLLVGGEVEGAVMQPAVLDGVSSAMRLYHEESFGPVASVMRVADTDEAISIANDTEFGLAGAVFGADQARCLDIANRLETGICQINGPTVYDDASMPFGGMKASGYGRFGGPASIDEFTELRWIAQHEAGGPSRLDQLLS